MFAKPIIAVGISLLLAVPALADDAADQAELAKKTLNPVADLISLPIQFNYESIINDSLCFPINEVQHE